MKIDKTIDSGQKVRYYVSKSFSQLGFKKGAFVMRSNPEPARP